MAKAASRTLRGDGPVNNDEVTQMVNQSNDSRESVVDGKRNHGPEERLVIGSHKPRRGGGDGHLKSAEQAPAARSSVPKREATSSWVNWQSAVYVFVLFAACLVLAPLTNLWWIVPVLGAFVPLARALLKSPDDEKSKEGELLRALTERGELTPTAVAMRTSLTIEEASKMLDELAGKGHLKVQTEDGIVAFGLRERDRPPAPGKVETSPERVSQNCTDLARLEVPLSEREREVLTLLASGRTNSEIARTLFVAVGTVKSHVNNIYRKLDARNRAEAVTRARESNLLR
jgi:DNA-binding CsgD family transcriptional regulator